MKDVMEHKQKSEDQEAQSSKRKEGRIMVSRLSGIMRVETDEARLRQVVENFNRMCGNTASAELVAGDDGVPKIRVRVAGINGAKDSMPMCPRT